MFRCILSLLALLTTTYVIAQQTQTLSPASSISLVDLNEVEVVGYDGNEIQIEAAHKLYKNKRAEGMRILSPSGLMDNTGAGLYKEEKNGEIILTQISVNMDNSYVIKVPKQTNVHYTHASHHGDVVVLKNLDGKATIDASFNEVVLINHAGECDIVSQHGSINATFDKLPENGRIRLKSSHDDVDVSIPASAKANIRLSSSHGAIYTNLDFEQTTSNGNLTAVNPKNLNGTLNGGGTDLTIESTHDNIYLRKS